MRFIVCSGYLSCKQLSSELAAITPQRLLRASWRSSVFKRHSFAVLALLATTTSTTSPDCSLEGAKLPPVTNSATCSSLSPDIQASGGWRGVESPQVADGALFFTVQARPTVAGLNGLVAVAPQEPRNFPDAAILVRFNSDGLVDVRNGAIYDSGLVYPYEPGVWYDISISADLDNQTYSVDIGRCGAERIRLIDEAAFRSDAPDSSSLTHWAAWSSQGATLDLVTPSWGTTGGCQPSTCQSLGRECGSASDGCGGTLNCGDAQAASSARAACVSRTRARLPLRSHRAAGAPIHRGVARRGNGLLDSLHTRTPAEVFTNSNSSLLSAINSSACSDGCVIEHAANFSSFLKLERTSGTGEIVIRPPIGRRGDYAITGGVDISGSNIVVAGFMHNGGHMFVVKGTNRVSPGPTRPIVRVSLASRDTRAFARRASSTK